MQRIMIVGQPGSGKSTLARALGEVTRLPVIHIDHIHWQAGWIERSREEKTRLCLEAEAGSAWIFEGGHSITWPSRAARADLVIWLDIPLRIRAWRVLKRTVLWAGRSRPDLPAGCNEGSPRQILPFWHYIWKTRISGRRNIHRLLEGLPPEKPIIHLSTKPEVDALLLAWPNLSALKPYRG